MKGICNFCVIILGCSSIRAGRLEDDDQLWSFASHLHQASALLGMRYVVHLVSIRGSKIKIGISQFGKSDEHDLKLLGKPGTALDMCSRAGSDMLG